MDIGRFWNEAIKLEEAILDVKEKVFTRDIFNSDS